MKTPFLKFLIVMLMIVIAFAGLAFAGMYVHDQTTAVSLIAADVRAATYTGNDVNVRKYRGQGKLILDAEAQGSGVTTTVTVQQSALASGATGSTTGDADLKLNLSTGGTPTLAVTFTQSGIRQIKHLDLKLKKTGTIASDKVLTAYLYSNSTTTPNAVLATSGTVLANGISTSYQTVRFTLTTPYQLADATAYWVALDSNYAASDSNYISWHVATVASGGTAATSDGSTWTAVTTQNPLFTLYQYAFADVVTFTGVGNTASLQSSAIDLDAAGIALRGVGTVAGGSSTGAYSLILVAPTPNQ